NNGFAQPSIGIVDLQNQIVREALRLDHAWLGMAWHPDGKRLYVSGAGNNTVHELRWAKGSLTRGTDLALGPPMPSPEERADHPEAVQQNFIGGLTIAPDGARLFAVHVFGQLLSVVDLTTRRVVHRVDLPAEPYTCIVSPDGATVFVSIWGGAKILMYD